MNIIKSVLDADWVNLQSHFEKEAAQKVMNKINDKKVSILAKINGISEDQMKESMQLTESKKEYTEDDVKSVCKKMKYDISDKDASKILKNAGKADGDKMNMASIKKAAKEFIADVKEKEEKKNTKKDK